MKIALCGSTRFMSAFGDWNIILTKAGHVVYSLAILSAGVKVPTPEEKRRYDLVHLQKIAESDAIVVLNVSGYIGDTVTREIEFARMLRKDVFWLENQPANKGILGVSVWSLYDLFEDRPISSILESEAYQDR